MSFSCEQKLRRVAVLCMLGKRMLKPFLWPLCLGFPRSTSVVVLFVEQFHSTSLGVQPSGTKRGHALRAQLACGE